MMKVTKKIRVHIDSFFVLLSKSASNYMGAHMPTILKANQTWRVI